MEHARELITAMLKSHIEELRELLHAIREDACDSFPTLRKSILFDLRTLDRSIDARGLPLLVDDMPRLGKHFDRCLSEGKWVTCALPLSKRASKHVCLPRFLVGLFLLVFDGGGDLREDCDVEAIFFLRQVLYLAKKARITCSEENTDAEVASFFELDASLPEPEQFWFNGASAKWYYKGFAQAENLNTAIGMDPFSRGSATFLRYLDSVFRELIGSLGEYNPSEWPSRHGPGAVAEVSGKKDKYLFDNWPEQLERVFPCAEHAFHNVRAWTTGYENLTEAIRPSRLISVPKTFSKPRLIAAEPSENMWCQQSIWNYMSKRTETGLIGEFITFHDQSRNQRLCTRGSVDGSLCTIDLSAASDRVTCHVVGQAFKWNLGLLDALRATRTQEVVWPKGLTMRDYRGSGFSCENGRSTKLRKFSTMGSACTFPVESIIFLGVALASVLYERRLQVTKWNLLALREEVSVFGDDLIIPKDAWDCVTKALELLWFKVNPDKSFRDGLFRESCGVDVYAGENVTPVYWHSPITQGAESVASYIATFNNFKKKFLLRTAGVLEARIPRNFKTWVSADSSMPGLLTFVRPTRLHYNVRWSKDLHRMEARIYSPKSSSTLIPANSDSALLKYFRETAVLSPFQKWEAGTPSSVVMTHHHAWVPISELYLK